MQHIIGQITAAQLRSIVRGMALRIDHVEVRVCYGGFADVVRFEKCP
jgi:hypothetical protein